MWKFTGLKVTRGRPRRTDLSKAQKDRRGQFSAILYAALESKVSSPIFSGYHVRAAIGPVGNEILTGGNREYGICHGLHTEACLVAAYRSRLNGRRERRRLIIGLIAGEEGNPATPCGDCRDILLSEFGSHADRVDIVSGSATGGTAIVTTLDQYFFERFRKTSDLNPLNNAERLICHAPFEGTRRANLPPYALPGSMEPYTAVIGTTTGTSGTEEHMTLHSIGSMDLDAAFHPLYPLEDALRDAIRKNSGRRLKYAVIVADGRAKKPPHVPYRDRQRLTEFHAIDEMMTGKTFDPPVYLLRVNEEKVVHAWRTSVKQWLRLPFTPKNFGSDAVVAIAAYYRAKNCR